MTRSARLQICANKSNKSLRTFKRNKLIKLIYIFQHAEIRCMKMASRERFSAVISTPEGLQGAAPVFEDRPTVDPITSRVCQIQPTERSNTFRLEVSNLDACGVKSCNQDGQVKTVLYNYHHFSVIFLMRVNNITCSNPLSYHRGRVAMALLDAPLSCPHWSQTSRR